MKKLVVFLLLIVLASAVYGADVGKRLSIGYDGLRDAVSVRGNLKTVGLELILGMSESLSDTKATAGLRLCLPISMAEKLNLNLLVGFIGFFDYTLGSASYNEYAGNIALGPEFFILPKLSVGAEFGISGIARYLTKPDHVYDIFELDIYGTPLTGISIRVYLN